MRSAIFLVLVISGSAFARPSLEADIVHAACLTIAQGAEWIEKVTEESQQRARAYFGQQFEDLGEVTKAGPNDLVFWLSAEEASLFSTQAAQLIEAKETKALSSTQRLPLMFLLAANLIHYQSTWSELQNAKFLGPGALMIAYMIAEQVMPFGSEKIFRDGTPHSLVWLKLGTAARILCTLAMIYAPVNDLWSVMGTMHEGLSAAIEGDLIHSSTQNQLILDSIALGLGAWQFMLIRAEAKAAKLLLPRAQPASPQDVLDVPAEQRSEIYMRWKLSRKIRLGPLGFQGIPGVEWHAHDGGYLLVIRAMP